MWFARQWNHSFEGLVALALKADLVLFVSFVHFGACNNGCGPKRAKKAGVVKLSRASQQLAHSQSAVQSNSMASYPDYSPTMGKLTPICGACCIMCSCNFTSPECVGFYVEDNCLCCYGQRMCCKMSSESFYTCIWCRSNCANGSCGQCVQVSTVPLPIRLCPTINNTTVQLSILLLGHSVRAADWTEEPAHPQCAGSDGQHPTSCDVMAVR